MPGVKTEMEMISTREWISFFQEARIPRSAAAQYAMTFTENRITMDMLMDLNKASCLVLYFDWRPKGYAHPKHLNCSWGFGLAPTYPY